MNYKYYRHIAEEGFWANTLIRIKGEGVWALRPLDKSVKGWTKLSAVRPTEKTLSHLIPIAKEELEHEVFLCKL